MQVPASLAGFPKLIYKYKQSLQVQSKLCHVLCHGCCRCMAMVGTMLQLHLLCGHGVCRRTTFCVTGTVIVWPRWASCCGCICCVAAVYVVVPHFVLHGAVVAWPWWVSCCGHVCCMAAVCVIMPHIVLRVLSLHSCGGRHVAVAFVAWLQCVL